MSKMKQGAPSVAVPAPATDLTGIRRIFDSALVVDPDTDLYEPRSEFPPRRSAMDLEDAEGSFHALCVASPANVSFRE